MKEMDFDRAVVYFSYDCSKGRQIFGKLFYLLKEVPNTCLFCIADTFRYLKKHLVFEMQILMEKKLENRNIIFSAFLLVVEF